MPRQSKGQKGTVARVMHEFKEGELRTGDAGPKVKSRRQAIAIALHEAGSTNQESPRKNKQNLAKTKTKERRGQTAEARKEGVGAQRKTMKRATETKPGRSAARGSSARGGRTKAALYAEAKKRNIAGRSRMSKAQLERALG